MLLGCVGEYAMEMVGRKDSERKRRRGDRRIMLQLFCGVVLGPNRRAEMCSSNWATEEINRMQWKYMMSTENRGIGLVCCR